MDTDKTQKSVLTASTDRIREAVEDNLRYSHLARKDTLDMKARSVHVIYERRMLKLYELINKEMDVVQYNVARLTLDNQLTLPRENMVDARVIKTAAEDKLAEPVVETSPDVLIQDAEDSTGRVDTGNTPHGTLRAYTKHKCRCGPCRRAKSEDGRKYRERRKARAQAAKDMKKNS
jgi:hypothetical protein